MAVNSKFIADFDDFYRAVTKAEASLKGFETGADKAGAAVDAVSKTSSRFDSLKSVITDIGAGLAGAFTVGAVTQFASNVVNTASALQDLSDRTHIGVEEIQLLAGAMSEFGVDQDELAKGLFGLSRRIAQGDDSVELALRRMGKSLSDVRDMKGEELFLEIEHGLATLQGGLRDTTASDLFGSKLGMAMAGASEGIDGAMEAARRMNNVMSKESVAALDHFGESIERAKRNLTAMSANVMGPLAEGFNTLFDAVSKGASKWDVAMSMLPKGFMMIGTGADSLTKTIDDLNQQTEKHVTTVTQVGVAHENTAGSIHKTKAEIEAENEEVKKLTDAWKQSEEILRDLHAQTFNQTMKFLREERQERQKATEERNKEVIAGLSEIQKVEMDYHDLLMKQTLSESDYQIMKIWEVADAQIKAFKGTEEQLIAFSDAVYTYAQAQADAVTVVDTSLTQLQKDAITTFAVIGGASQQSAEATVTSYEDAYSKSAAAFEQFKGVVVAGTHGIMESMIPVMNASDWITRKWQMEQAQRDRGEFFLTGFGGGMPPRAAGGSVSAGATYLVGERGPELFRPNASGTIIPNGVGGGMVNNFYVNGSVKDLAKPLMDELTRMMRQSRLLPSA